MATQLVMLLEDERNVKAQIAWCKQYHVKYQVIETVAMPTGVIDTPKPNTDLHLEEEKPSKAPMVGKKMWQEDFVTVTNAGSKDYRVYLEVPALLYKKGEKLTPKQARERAEYIKDTLKKEAKSFGAVWAGNYDKHDFFWKFDKKSDAEKFIASRKEYAEKRTTK